MKYWFIVRTCVIYHGKRKWENPKTIGNWLKGYDELPTEIQKNIPNFDFVYYDFSLDGENNLKGNPKLQAYLALSKHIFSPNWEDLIEVLVQFEKLLKEDNLVYFDTKNEFYNYQNLPFRRSV